VIFLVDFSIVKIFLIILSCYHDSYFKYFMFEKYNSFVSKARVSACMYFLVNVYKFPLDNNFHLQGRSTLFNQVSSKLGISGTRGPLTFPHNFFHPPKFSSLAGARNVDTFNLYVVVFLDFKFPPRINSTYLL
jgi:hypothetical protein